MRRQANRNAIRIAVWILLLTAGGKAARTQQPPNGSTALANQLQIPVKYQIMRSPRDGWESGRAAPGESHLISPGCLRISTGKPAKTVYYIIDSSHRYAFTAQGHSILLVNNTGDDRTPIDKTNKSNPACIRKE